MKKSILAAAVASLLSPIYSVQAEDVSAQDTVVVTASRFEQEQKSVLADVEIITQEDIQRSQSKTIPEALRKLPGVEIAQNGGRGQSSSIFVRGTGSDQVLVLVDGVRIARAAKGSVNFNQIPVSSIERIEYIRGARASIYGSEAIGGVINLITKAHSSDNQDTAITLGLGSLDYQESSISSGSAVGDAGHVNVAVGKIEDDGYNVKPLEGLNDGDRHGFDSLYGSLGYTHQLNDSVSLYSSIRAYDNIYQYDGSSTFSSTHQMKEAQRTDLAGMFGVRYQKDSLSSEVKLSYQTQDENDYDYGSSKKSGTVGSLEQSNLQWINAYTVDTNTYLVGGLDWRNSMYDDENANETFSRDNAAIYGVLSTQQLGALIEVSARLDDNEDYGNQETYSLGLGYDVSDNFGVKASYGTAFKAPNLYQLHGAYGDDTLTPETSTQSELSFYGYVGAVRLSLTGYHYLIEDLIDYSFTTSSYANVDGESEIKGVELVSEFDLLTSHHQIIVEYKDARDSEGEWLSRRAQNTAKWNAAVPFGDFDWSVTGIYVGRRDNSQYDSTILSSYSLFDTALNYYANENTTISARIANVFDRQYETASGYDSADRAYYLTLDYVF